MTKITCANYDQQAMHFGKTVKKWGDSWPFLSHDPDRSGNADEAAWTAYFAYHLGGFPKSFELFRKGRIRYYNVPAATPEQFDVSYNPQPGFKPPLVEHHGHFTDGYRERMAERFEQLLDDLRNRRLSRDSGKQGPALPGTVFTNFDEAVRRHGKPRSAFERTRKLP